MKSEEELADLQREAELVLSAYTEIERLRIEEKLRGLHTEGHTPSPDPIVVEFAGSPKSGKSTVIECVRHFFRRMGFRVWAPTEGASKRTPHQLRRDLFSFNAWSLMYAISELLVSIHNADRPHIIILDRGPFDALAWMRLLHDRHQLSAIEYEIIQDFALHPKWRDVISRICLFTCEPGVSLQRENKMKLTLRPGSAMNEETLSPLLEKYKALRADFPGIPIRAYDTTAGTTSQMLAFDIALDVISLMKERVGCSSEFGDGC